MKRECIYTRKSLRKYLRGHLFMLQKIRVERHLRHCVVCSSEYKALKKEDETRQLLRDITPVMGIVPQLKEGVSRLAGFKKLLYRPLWLAAILGVIALVCVNLLSRQRDVEIENLEKSLPQASSLSVRAASLPTGTIAAAPTQTVAAVKPVPAPAPVREAPALEPLAITITAAGDDSIGRINEVMRGYGTLRGMQFSGAVREISGSLTAAELRAFLSRIESAGKVSYNRRRFESVPDAQAIPFVMKLKAAPKTAAQPIPPSSPSTTVYQPAETTARPLSAPSQTSLP